MKFSSRGTLEKWLRTEPAGQAIVKRIMLDARVESNPDRPVPAPMLLAVTYADRVALYCSKRVRFREVTQVFTQSDTGYVKAESIMEGRMSLVWRDVFEPIHHVADVAPHLLSIEEAYDNELDELVYRTSKSLADPPLTSNLK